MESTSENLKQLGNKEFAKKNYIAAIDYYTKAIAI